MVLRLSHITKEYKLLGAPAFRIARKHAAGFVCKCPNLIILEAEEMRCNISSLWMFEVLHVTSFFVNGTTISLMTRFVFCCETCQGQHIHCTFPLLRCRFGVSEVGVRGSYVHKDEKRPRVNTYTAPFHR